jgi:predicted naringenin-chalcone synthase
MSSLRAAACCKGAFEYSQATVKQYVSSWLNGSSPHHEKILRSFDQAQVERRSSVEPIEYIFGSRGFEESNDRYRIHAVSMALEVASACIERAGLRPEDIDYFISTSCTGFMIPSLDAYVAEKLGMRPSLRRLPITEHGCAAGAVALTHAHDYLLGHPDHRVLVVAVELPSLTFQPLDRRPTNVISTALFGDGAAAAVVGGPRDQGLPHIVRSASHRFPDSLDWMGFELKDSGLHIVLSPRVPGRIREQARPLIEDFLAVDGLSIADVDHFLLHPGGRRFVEAFEETLDLPANALATSRRILRESGNLSSATVLFILEEYLREQRGRPGDRGLLMAFGPGFSAEMLLLQW